MAAAGTIPALLSCIRQALWLPPKSTPLDALKFLMDQNNLRAADLLDVFGSRAVASQVLTGKREISKAHARRLADRFRLSVEAFI